MDRTSFKDQAVVITGASSGIGKALSLRLAEQGAWLGLTARDASRLETLAAECHNKGGKAMVLPGDISEEAHCQSLIERTVQEYGRLDMLINNAGFGVGARFQDYPDLNLFMRVMGVNFNGSIYCTFYALPHLIRSKGRLVNVSSLAGKFPLPFNSPYIASKFALSGFSDTLRLELAKQGVSVTVIYPFWVVTEFHERFMDKTGQPTGPRGRKIYSKRTMTAERCAEIITEAAWKRRREVVMPPGRLALWLRLVAPILMDRIIVDRFLQPAVKRVSREKAKP
jgi:short-subunit dehydrogenase